MSAIGNRFLKAAAREPGSETRGTVFERIDARETGPEIRGINYNSLYEARVSREHGNSPVLLSLWSYVTAILRFDTIAHIKFEF
jgi:hypothetical protein